MSLNLRKKTRVCYYEPEEPAFDEYIYCEDCSDFVYEYCSIHGPLLVIPDDKVPNKSNFPSYVPRAALTIPRVFLHLAPSIIPGAGLGVFSTLTLPRGVRFGPYCGQQIHDVESMYCWQIYDRNHKPSHVVDAGDAGRSNWMRYVNCARHWREQNLVAYQYQGRLYYRTIKIIPRFTELMVFYGGEFAQKLHINVSNYNTDGYYQEMIGTSLTHVVEIAEINEVSNIENAETHSEITTPCFSDEKFEFIDEEIDVDCDRANDKSVGGNIIDFNGDDCSGETTKTVTYEAGNIVIKFKNDICSLHKCNICQRSFASRRNLRNHSRIHALSQIFSCSECNFTTKHNKSLNRHAKTHRIPYKCRYCMYETNTKVIFDKHACIKNDSIKNSTVNGKVRKCEFCDFTTFSRKILYTHVSKHKGRVFLCDLCEYSSYCKCNLVRHLRRHK